MNSHTFPPTRALVIFCAVVLVTMAADQALAQLNVSTVPRTVSYQGYLESGGTPFDGVANFKFVISCGLNNTAWSNDGSSVNGLEPAAAVPLQVVQGAFAVLLGDSTLNMPLIQPESYDGCNSVNLKIWVDTGSGFEGLPAQPVVSAIFALTADSAYRSIGGFNIQGGPLLITDDLDRQVVQVLPRDVGPFDGPAVYLANADGDRTISVIGDVGQTRNPAISLFDSTGTETMTLDGATGEVRAAAIRFSDDSVQTTAATGGGGADSDWTVSGNDMYAAVSGNVGVGTSAPVGHLTVSRPTQTTDHQLELRNVGSIQSPNFDGIRFTQGPNGETTLGEMRLDYRNNGRPDLGFHLRNRPNILYLKSDSGNVGIGTAIPASTLDVAGDLTVSGPINANDDLTVGGAIDATGGLTVGGGIDATGDLTVSGAINAASLNLGPMTRYLAVPAAAFTPELDTMNYKQNGYNIYGTTPGQLVRFYAPLNLPHGATITEFRTVVDDLEPNLNDNITVYLTEWPHFGGSGSIIVNTFTTNAPGTYAQLSQALSTAVDNENNHYGVTVSWDTPASGNTWDMRLRSVRITYEVAQLAP